MSRTATSIVALLAGLMWPGGPVLARAVTMFAPDSPQIVAMTLRHDPDDEAEDDAEDDEEDDFDDFDDDEDIGDEDDEPDDEDDEIDELDELDDEDSSGHGSGDEEDEEDDLDSPDDDDDDDENDSSGHGSDGSDGDDDEDDEDNSGHDDDDEKDDEDNSGRSHSDDDDDDDNSGRSHGDDADDIYEEFIDDDGFRAVDDEFLVLVSRSDLEDGKFDKADFEIQHDLTALDMVMLRVRIDEDDDLAVRMRERAVGDGDATVDLNHYYAPDYGPDAQDDRLARDEQKEALFVPASDPPASDPPVSNPPVSNPMALPTVLAASLGLDMARELRGRVGMIDTTVNMGHSALVGASVTVQDFASRGNQPLSDHGTMIASILVGSEPGAFLGIAPNYEILAANVFFQKPDGQVLASVESLILALEWLVAEDVQVINMSLSGPPNRLLERAISQARTVGTIVVAAVGNGGPAAKPLYPAAYGEVVAVTAVDRRMNIYLSAGRGGHLDFAAPGVDMLTAKAEGGFKIRSGTSLAAPFVTIVLSEMRQQSTLSWPEILAALKVGAQDLGETGFDPVFGYGLIQVKR